MSVPCSKVQLRHIPRRAYPFPMGSKTNSEEGPLVLVVDDSASIRSSTRRLVRSFGFRAEAFASAAELLASPLLDACACLILDVRMPRVDGLDLQVRLAEMRPQLPIVFFTAHGNEDEENQAMTAGAVAFLRKPVMADTLLNTIQHALQHRPPG